MVDETDRRLIQALQRDGRQPVAELARRLDLPRTTVQDRLRRLMEEGVILGFEPVLDHAKLGNPVTAIVFAAFQAGADISQKELASRIAEVEGVEEVHVISGEWDLFLKVRAATIEDVGEKVVEGVRNIEGVARTLTSASFHGVRSRP